MTDGTGHESAQAAPGWYPDPYQPSKLRYWDGHDWTDHYHDKRADGSLPPIGEWLGNTFSAIGAYGFPALGLAVGGSIIINVATAALLTWSITDERVVDQEFVGDVTSLFLRLGILMLVITVLQGAFWLAINRFMHRAHMQSEPTIPDALQHAAKRFPRFVGVLLLVILAAGLAMFVLGLIVVGLGPAGGVLGIVVLIPFFCWFGVKMAFLSTAVVAAPTSTSAVKASMGVSKGRFWGVLGRILLVTLGIFLVSSMATGALGELASPVDQDTLQDIVVAQGDTIILRDFSISELMPSGGQWIAYVIINSLIGAATGLVSTSAFMRLYLDSGAPAEI